ncbi:hypothetical protein LINPERPRIM_LOCUS22489 [Linum perenne]
MRGRDRTWRFWIFRSKLLSVKRRITTFLVSESLAVRVSRRVLEPRLLVRVLPSENVTKDVSKALGPRGIKPESIKESTKSRTGNLPDYKDSFGELNPWVSPKPEEGSQEPEHEDGFAETPYPVSAKLIVESGKSSG